MPADTSGKSASLNARLSFLNVFLSLINSVIFPQTQPFSKIMLFSFQLSGMLSVVYQSGIPKLVIFDR